MPSLEPPHGVLRWTNLRGLGDVRVRPRPEDAAMLAESGGPGNARSRLKSATNSS